MTTKIARYALWAVLALGLGVGCVTGRSSRRGGLPASTVATYPKPVQSAYGLFAVKCSRCHTLSRPLNAAIYDYAHWAKYVTRMRRHSGSGISPSDGDEILVFLKYYADQNAPGTKTATTGAQR